MGRITLISKTKTKNKGNYSSAFPTREDAKNYSQHFSKSIITHAQFMMVQLIPFWPCDGAKEIGIHYKPYLKSWIWSFPSYWYAAQYPLTLLGNCAELQLQVSQIMVGVSNWYLTCAVLLPVIFGRFGVFNAFLTY